MRIEFLKNLDYINRSFEKSVYAGHDYYFYFYLFLTISVGGTPGIKYLLI